MDSQAETEREYPETGIVCQSCGDHDMIMEVDFKHDKLYFECPGCHRSGYAPMEVEVR